MTEDPFARLSPSLERAPDRLAAEHGYSQNPPLLSLTATIMSESGEVAIINGAEYHPGEILWVCDRGYLVKSVAPGCVRLSADDGEFFLKIRS